MLASNFHVIRQGHTPEHGTYYAELDINSRKFKKETDIPEGTELQETPRDEWTTEDIAEIIGSFFNDRGKEGVFYDPLSWREAM